MIRLRKIADAEEAARHARKRAPKRARPRSGRGALAVVSVLLVGSALLRSVEYWGLATALEAEEPSGESAAETRAPAPNFEEILAALDAREARIAEREALLDTRAEAIALAEQRLEEKIAELTEAEEQLRSTISLSESAAENDLAQLTSVYENMGAEEAAALFSQMTPNFAAGFLGRMRPDIAAAILAGLDPGNAYEISVILAGRNALAPTE